MTPAAEPILQFFDYMHLPPHLREASEPFCRLAKEVAERFPRGLRGVTKD